MSSMDSPRTRFVVEKKRDDEGSNPFARAFLDRGARIVSSHRRLKFKMDEN